MKLEVKNLYKKFGETEILHGISFDVESGKALGLLGRNGAGKTTTIRIIMNVFRANQGEVLLDGKPVEKQQVSIGYLPEERGLYPKKKVGEQIVYLACLRGMKPAQARKNMRRWLERMGVEEYENRKLETLSKGNQQKVQLAQTLVCDPQLIILDEPFSGLDPVNSQILKDVIQEQIQEGKLVVFSSHQMNYVEEFCEEIVLINRGEIVLSGNLRKIKQEFGHNRLVLSLVGRSGEEVQELVRERFSDLAAAVGCRKEQAILQLVQGVDKRRLMAALAEADLDVEQFGNYEPSLGDIFVEKAGDQA
ncbi:MAG TPA: ATP-binding cassette domain-containing protein [Candidatus Scatomonas merdavium]|nr:ATP-binding cassette domain-containing protein [Candidatus Scatomonas merdavium]